MRAQRSVSSPFRIQSLLSFGLLAVVASATAAEPDPFTKREPPPLAGRWDLTVRDGDTQYPSWLEFKLSGFRTLVGSYVGQFGSARPVASVALDNGHFQFVVPPQWERRTNDIRIEGQLDGDVLRGQTLNDKGEVIHWEGRRAPALTRTQPPKWGNRINLFNAHDLTGWKPRNAKVKNGWRVQDGALVNAEPGNDLMTEQKFTDFKLHAEFRYPKGSNSGIYLRGRYEVQLEDNFGRPPESHEISGVYGFLTPRINASKPAGEWQSVDITLEGRAVSVVLNGELVIDRQEIPGITGSALDSNEAEPGPILVQGDHGKVEFRKLAITPAK